MNSGFNDACVNLHLSISMAVLACVQGDNLQCAYADINSAPLSVSPFDLCTVFCFCMHLLKFSVTLSL